MSIILEILAVGFIVATVLPLLRHDKWWVRMFDFPRIRIAIGGLVIAGLVLVQWDISDTWKLVLDTALLLCVAYQVYKIFPYTPLAAVQVVRTTPEETDREISVLISNVLLSNRDSSRLLKLIRDTHPHVILTLETDQWWEGELRALEETFPHTVKLPKDDTYGILLYSRLPLRDTQIKFLREEHIPSIHTRVELPCGVTVRLYGLHPAPPYPKYALETTNRDAELFLVGKEVQRKKEPTIVMGDLNDVAWSYTTDLFQKTSGLLDPRIGRGTFSTFPVRFPLLHCPVDHVFVSADFKLIELQRLSDIGSDHFPMLARLQYTSDGRNVQERPRADAEEAELVDDKIEESENS